MLCGYESLLAAMIRFLDLLAVERIGGFNMTILANMMLVWNVVVVSVLLNHDCGIAFDRKIVKKISIESKKLFQKDCLFLWRSRLREI